MLLYHCNGILDIYFLASDRSLRLKLKLRLPQRLPAKMASTHPMKHIDRGELYTSLEARIQYLQSFLDFSNSG